MRKINTNITEPDESNYIQWCVTSMGANQRAINAYLVSARLALFHIITSYNGEAHNIIMNIFFNGKSYYQFEIIKVEKFFFCIYSRPPDDR